MGEDAVGALTPEEEAELRRQAAKLRTLADVFGDVLPEATRDEIDEESAAESTTDRDADLRRDVPPHHGP